MSSIVTLREAEAERGGGGFSADPVFVLLLFVLFAPLISG